MYTGVDALLSLTARTCYLLMYHTGNAGADGRFGDVFQQTRQLIHEEKALYGKSHLPLKTIAKELVER